MAKRKDNGAVIIDVTLIDSLKRAEFVGESVAVIAGLLNQVERTRLREAVNVLEDTAKKLICRWPQKIKP